MNTQDILRHSRTQLDGVIDFSEYYDYELVENIIGKVDAVLDFSEYYDYELVEIIVGKIDVVLDYSEYYDYTLGDNVIDYIYHETFVIVGSYLLTEDNYIIKTEDNYYIEI